MNQTSRLSGALRSYALTLPVVFNQPAVAALMLEREQALRNDDLLALLSDVATKLGHDGLRAALQTYSSKPLPKKLGRFERKRFQQRIVLANGPAVRAPLNRLPHLAAGRVACSATMPQSLTGMQESEREAFGVARRALFLGDCVAAENGFAALDDFDAARVQRAYALIGRGDVGDAIHLANGCPANTQLGAGETRFLTL